MMNLLILNCLRTTGRPCKGEIIKVFIFMFYLIFFRVIPEVVFQEIEATPSQKIRKQCLNYYHCAQKHVILGTLSGEGR